MNRLLYVLLFLCLLVFLSPLGSNIEFFGESEKQIRIEVKGEVDNPGVFTLPYRSSVDDLLQQLQLNSQADLSSLNLTAILKDHDVIVIPAISETSLISINSADSSHLQDLPHIGPVIAQRIIDYRNNVGTFQKLEDIMNVRGIGKKTFEAIRELICL